MKRERNPASKAIYQTACAWLLCVAGCVDARVHTPSPDIADAGTRAASAAGASALGGAHGDTAAAGSLAAKDAGQSSSDAGGPALTCAQRMEQADNVLAPIFQSAQSELTCDADSDCMFVWPSTDCTGTCGALINQQIAGKLDSAIAQVNATICGGPDAGCRPVQLPCPSIGGGLVACVSGTCQFFPPAAWQSVSIVQQAGAPGTFSTPPSCTGGDCTWWKITPDATLVISKGGPATTVQLSAADFAVVDGVLRSMSFRQLQAGTTLSCDTPPSGQEVSIDIERSGAVTGFDVTGCALVGPAGNDALTLYKVVQEY